ncbi:endonuclease/exonuclease/phosphatase family protein [Morganella psychrotolerans]|uniref:endonuclease/exonuclease/phosphatase family protein n=1 Tax=Morganella psychrotolerans TaxID=368603 RepID=UPI0039B0B9D3
MNKKKTWSVRYVAGLPAQHIPPMSADMLGSRLPVGLPISTPAQPIRVVVWNIYKQQRPEWQKTLDKLLCDTQLALLQEAQPSPELVNLSAKHQLIADQVPALRFQQHPSGVMTLATSHPVYCCPLQQKEPLLRLAKSALITVYPLPDGRQLMVINVHAINFSFGVDVYRHQLNTIGSQIRCHIGPVIMGGDFNAWSRQRMHALKWFARTLRLKEVIFPVDIRTRAFGHPLDYVFYRGFKLIKSDVMLTNASDHHPLIAEFQ